MRSRSLGLLFVTAVILPSILLAVLSVRAAGREEAFVERQLATTLDAETARVAGLANAEVARMVDELRAGIDVPAGSNYGGALRGWKAGSALVDVPFLLSPRFGILWPPGSGSGSAEKKFLRDQGDFLSDRTSTTILQNIADRYQKEILAQSGAPAAPAGAMSTAPSTVSAGAAAPLTAAPMAAAPVAAPPTAAPQAADARAASAPAASAPAATPPAVAPAVERASSSNADVTTVDAQGSASNARSRQLALDAFAQSQAIQTEVYQAAAENGDQLSARVAQPVSKALSNAPTVPPSGTPTETADKVTTAAASPEAALSDGPGPNFGGATSGAATSAGPNFGGAPSPAPSSLQPRPSQSQQLQPQPPQSQPSQYVVTSQLLSQIASAGTAGIIPRFTSAGLVFLFWERQADGRIAGCQIAGGLFRSRIASVLEGTTTASRIITFLDENGTPLAAPPGDTGRDWRRPFVSREIGVSLPRWEAAAYLARPDAISSQARSTSLVIWIMVLILFVSVAGGGSLVLSSVYGEMRTAQQKATFVTNVSHELKTPLTSISLFVELLRKKGPLSAEKRDSYLSHMASETERLTRLINNVLDFSGTRRYSLDTVDASAVAAEVLEGQRVRLESLGFTVTMEPPRGECMVRADPGAFKQVLLNLLSNAEKYSRERKEVVVRVEAGAEPVTPPRPRPGVARGASLKTSRRARPRGGLVLVHVLDRGIGVPDKERERIFREFYRVDDALASRVRGTGLGLTIARRIARDHGGEITCAPRAGGGSDFTVRLPRAEREEG